MHYQKEHRGDKLNTKLEGKEEIKWNDFHLDQPEIQTIAF